MLTQWTYTCSTYNHGNHLVKHKQVTAAEKGEVDSVKCFKNIAFKDTKFQEESVFYVGRQSEKTVTFWLYFVRFGALSYEEKSTRELPMSVIKQPQSELIELMREQ